MSNERLGKIFLTLLPGREDAALVHERRDVTRGTGAVRGGEKWRNDGETFDLCQAMVFADGNAADLDVLACVMRGAQSERSRSPAKTPTLGMARRSVTRAAAMSQTGPRGRRSLLIVSQKVLPLRRSASAVPLLDQEKGWVQYPRMTSPLGRS